jgi:hypothetical protein
MVADLVEVVSLPVLAGKRRASGQRFPSIFLPKSVNL